MTKPKSEELGVRITLVLMATGSLVILAVTFAHYWPYIKALFH